MFVDNLGCFWMHSLGLHSFKKLKQLQRERIISMSAAPVNAMNNGRSTMILII